MELYNNHDKNIHIEANVLNIGENVTFGNDISIKVKGKFEIGNHSVIGDRFKADAEEIVIGEYFFNLPTDSRGMIIGGGGASYPYSKLKIGDRAVCHTGHINLAAPVNIGNDVGLSHDVELITHGFWASILDGYPRKVEGINIGDNVIVGWKTTIMPGITISSDIVVGACSLVTKNLSEKRGIYGGNPAKYIKHVYEPSLADKLQMMDMIVHDFTMLMSWYTGPMYSLSYVYPLIYINDLIINVVDKSCDGEHDNVTDAFRDFLRKYGIRIFDPRGFRFNLCRKNIS